MQKNNFKISQNVLSSPEAPAGGLKVKVPSDPIT